MDEMDPLLNLLNLRPREDWSWKFEPAAEGENAVNAVALCNASLLAYSAQTDVQRFLAKWGFEEPRFLRSLLTQGFVARRGDIVIVAFRGTEPVNADDWLSNVNYHLRPVDKIPGLIHSGFAKDMDEREIVMPMLDAFTELSAGEKTRLFLTGHSLGGALAVLAAALFHFGKGQRIAGVFTYGQPRLSDSAFSTAFDQALGAVTFRYVNDLDVVPHVPPTRLPAQVLQAPPHLLDLLRKAKDLPNEIRTAISEVIHGEQFSHVGQLRLFLRDGSLSSDGQEWQNREVIYSGMFSELLRTAPNLLRAQLGQLLRGQNRLLDHDPLNGYLPKLEARAALISRSGGEGS
jgi:triacylglycerol lipase